MELHATTCGGHHIAFQKLTHGLDQAGQGGQAGQCAGVGAGRQCIALRHPENVEKVVLLLGDPSADRRQLDRTNRAGYVGVGL